MPRFQSEEACLTDCRCWGEQYVTPDNIVAIESERISLECKCATGDCVADAEEATQRNCEGFLAEYVTRVTGCGMVAIEIDAGYGKQSEVFDAASGELIGMVVTGDAPADPCQTYRTVAGQEFICEERSECRPCAAPSTSSVPRCE